MSSHTINTSSSHTTRFARRSSKIYDLESKYLWSWGHQEIETRRVEEEQAVELAKGRAELEGVINEDKKKLEKTLLHLESEWMMSLAVHEQQKTSIEKQFKETICDYNSRLQQLSMSYFGSLATSTTSWWERIGSLEASFFGQFAYITNDWWSRLASLEVRQSDAYTCTR